MILPSTALHRTFGCSSVWQDRASILTKMVPTYHFQNTPFADPAMVGSRRLEHATFITIP